MNFAEIGATDTQTRVNCNTPLVYQFTPPKCLKKITYKFEASSTDPRMNIAILDTGDLYYGNYLASILHLILHNIIYY